MDNLLTYALLVIIYISIELVILTYIVLPSCEEQLQKMGPPQIEESVYEIVFEAGIFAPIREELIFRLPVLICLIYTNTTLAIITAVIGGIVFGYVHRFNSDKMGNSLPWPIVIFHSTSGTVYGFIVIATQSILPAIILHCAWNLSIPLIQKIIDSFD